MLTKMLWQKVAPGRNSPQTMVKKCKLPLQNTADFKRRDIYD